jgi:hypothetical protein
LSDRFLVLMASVKRVPPAGISTFVKAGVLLVPEHLFLNSLLFSSLIAIAATDLHPGKKGS